MAATSPCSSSLSHHPLLSPSKTKLDSRKRVCSRISASGRESRDQNYFSGRIVDENMIVLRKRIHEMKMAERNYEPPSNWMGWEKRYFTSYDSLICEMMGFLQSQLMETRPSLALGFIALISLSVSMSTAMMFFQFTEMFKMTLGGLPGFD
ncbi:hypothetical protein OIU76_013828 [Salix suchowensis]|uniref:Uncharacterized protein n=1 Tax=Salix suchowensis TaxID=1278906 RepID=A0ABQ9A371_9ROSI|nr:hypothetical protein OIU76_013828 [Salix suchowensis]KAJ6321985.1 hypothetical protein OIU77_011965 [Salix suchowensis]